MSMCKFPILLFFGILAFVVTKKPIKKPRIAGGEDATIEKYPYQLALLYQNSYACGAAIVSDIWAITAAHCITMYVPKMDLFVRAGSSSYDKGGQLIKIDKIFPHPLYKKSEDYDLALLQLSSPIKFSQAAAPVKLANLKRVLVEGEMGIVTGWGVVTKGGQYAKVLQETRVPVILKKNCQKFFKTPVTDRMFCAGYVNFYQNACDGDSGAPFLVNGELVGIASWGNNCSNNPVVYTSIPPMRSFIKNMTGF